MADVALSQPSVQPVRQLNLIPVGLKEAALDSPTFRATALHFSDQIDIIERWLDGYVKAASKLVAEVSSLESLVNTFLSQSMPPAQVSEAALDHDYTLLAMQRYGEGAREFWQTTLRGIKRYDTAVVEPIKSFLSSELKNFKDARRALQATQKEFDHVVTRYLSQSKTKEASSLREDAFQLHEARKAYLKASMDFCIAAPNLRASLDKLIVRIFSDQWREMRSSREANATLFNKWSGEMERVRGWSREMENSERAFKRELLVARKQIEDTAESVKRPSRELDDYSASTVPYLGTGASSGATPSTPARPSSGMTEKQGWLVIKTSIGKPARTMWSRRWFFVKNGIFGWLIQGSRSGGVEESERIGVLLCSVRPAVLEERRFCFEVKTKDSSIILQAETQQELTEWISAFEVAKRKALEDPASTDASPQAPGIDPAFAITPPIAPEFAAKPGDVHAEDAASVSAAERENALAPVSTRASFDVGAPSGGRRVMSVDKETEDRSGKDHAARIIQKLDLHKRGGNTSAQPSSGSSAGGIASLISASHNILPVAGAPPLAGEAKQQRTFSMPVSTLAPSTLANPPAPTNLSHTAVVVSGERGVSLSGRGADGSGMPSGIMANLWGSSNWGYVNRLGDAPKREPQPADSSVTPRAVSVSQDDLSIMDGSSDVASSSSVMSPDVEGIRHRKTLSTDFAGLTKPTRAAENADEYPNYYPLPLKAQQAQFRMLFPSVPRSEKVVLVFRATWNPNDQQEFPGRVYVTTREVYFYSNHLGLVLITGVSLTSISDVTAAPGRDCDFLYLHMQEGSQRNADGPSRVTVKVFLEPLKLLQRRLNWLVHNANSDKPVGLEEALKTLLKMEVDEPQRSSSVESWEDVTYDAEEGATGGESRGAGRRERNVKASLRIDGSLYGGGAAAARTGREIQKFKLPGQPVMYAPQGMQASIARDFNVSAKALFHVMFGDKSAVFQLLYCNRWADRITQTPWVKTPGAGGHWTRQFTSQETPMQDTQSIDILNDHLCYVVTNTKRPFKLPYASRSVPITKIVITHTAKSRSKLAIFQAINWSKPPRWQYVRGLIEKQALNSLEADALDLITVAMDQTAKLGNHSKTNRAIEIFGGIGGQTTVPQLDTAAISNLGGTVVTGRIKQQKPMSMMGMVFDDALHRLFRMLGWVVDVVIAVSKAALSLCTAHSLLVALLALSAVYNLFFGYRDSTVWWRERSAGHFMARLGVRPEPTISRAIYLHDIDQLVAPPAVENLTMASLTPVELRGDVKTCRTTFSEQLTTSTSVASTGLNTGARLQRTRDSLAKYRYDLLVALKMVNRIERDAVSAEWEDWVRGEELKCSRVERMLQRKKGRKDQKGDDSGAGELGDDFASYCSSCRNELAGLGNGMASFI
ncbi:hypothetical protein BAUCODRAFT_28837 [Baudoinia panamericana UAMH 10762]|uniref:Uncharacterized protein n=1 Tax=Baudoinia panamericana (strain UAMH 10762) TaxID=717646 RepID=M2MU82_BAUPA|nr:uncharacterized protein BAUCODRAFT_28837 [Baudoinia panamericana UAMH 10762]EMD00482.1 hypothetical protein BAUCODRAFT_28837 [Baudoinia panamericana UAMH 10762]